MNRPPVCVQVSSAMGNNESTWSDLHVRGRYTRIFSKFEYSISLQIQYMWADLRKGQLGAKMGFSLNFLLRNIALLSFNVYALCFNSLDSFVSEKQVLESRADRVSQFKKLASKDWLSGIINEMNSEFCPSFEHLGFCVLRDTSCSLAFERARKCVYRVYRESVGYFVEN